MPNERFIVGENAIDEWFVIDTTCPQDQELVAREIATCPDEDAAKLVAYALNLLVRAQAGAKKEVSKAMRKNGRIIVPQ